MSANLPVSFGKSTEYNAIGKKTQANYDEYMTQEYTQSLSQMSHNNDESSFKTGLLVDSESDSDSDSDSDSESDSGDSIFDDYPISHSYTIDFNQDGSNYKAITSICHINSGSKFLFSSNTSKIPIFNYNNIQRNKYEPTNIIINPFDDTNNDISEFGLTIKNSPIIEKIVNNFDYPSDGSFIAIPRQEHIIKLFNDSGKEIWKSKKTDLKFQDLTQTFGHLDEINDVIFKKNFKNIVFTCSKDSTIRSWDINENKQKTVYQINHNSQSNMKSTSRSRVNITNLLAINEDSIAIGTEFGDLSILDTRITNKNNKGQFFNNLGEGKIISILKNPYSNNIIYARTSEGYLTLWDIRNSTKPIVFNKEYKIDNKYQNIVISPLGDSILFGSTGNKLHILDAADFSEKHEINTFFETTCINWNKEINQITVGLKNGKIISFFSPKNSTNGIKLSLEKPLATMMIKDSNNKTNSVFIDTTKLDNRKKKRKFNEHDDITNNGISDEEEDDDKNARVDMEPKIKEQTKLRDVVFEDPREAILKYSKK
ncbi:unnamed protein product [[Candida] boidinii]|uniref:Unnamed protein product n=1 Tax=Candida boidinii TaxID=5477 RepID=A0ACB5TH93_CANBO|nr:unnamed protein product [[Candida] boidinii]